MDTSKIVKAVEGGCIDGLYGNKLKINPDWSNPSGALRCPAHCSKPVCVCCCKGLPNVSTRC